MSDDAAQIPAPNLCRRVAELVDEPRTDLRPVEVGHENAAPFGTIVAASFERPQTLGRFLAGVVGEAG